MISKLQADINGETVSCGSDSLSAEISSTSCHSNLPSCSVLPQNTCQMHKCLSLGTFDKFSQSNDMYFEPMTHLIYGNEHNNCIGTINQPTAFAVNDNVVNQSITRQTLTAENGVDGRRNYPAINGEQATRNVISSQENEFIRALSKDETVSRTECIAATEEDDEEEFDENNEDQTVESPDGRWHRRRQLLDIKGLNGADASYLAIDSEEGVEVVWNEMTVCDDKQQSALHKIVHLFDNLVKLDHSNVVKLYGYWMEHHDSCCKVFFITEHMPTGSLKAFLKETKKTKQTLSPHSWRRWCLQLLSALNYLHTRDPPIVHGCLTTETIFIQNNGLLNVSSFSSEILHGKSFRWHSYFQSVDAKMITASSAIQKLNSAEHNRNFETTPSNDIFMLGVVALEMMNVDVSVIAQDCMIDENRLMLSICSLEPAEQDFIKSCLLTNAVKRPTASELLRHPVIFQLYSLRLLCALQIASYMDNRLATTQSSDSRSVEYSSKLNKVLQSKIGTDGISKDQDKDHNSSSTLVVYVNGREMLFNCSSNQKSDPHKQDLSSLLQDVRTGHYPLFESANYAEKLKSNETNNFLNIENTNDTLYYMNGEYKQRSRQTDLRETSSYSANQFTASSISDHCGLEGLASSTHVGLPINCVKTIASVEQKDSIIRNGSSIPTSPTSACQIIASSGTHRRSLIGTKLAEQTFEPEIRRISEVQTCKFEKLESNKTQLSLQLDMIDCETGEHMKRNLSTIILQTDTSSDVTDELIRYGFINKEDCSMMIEAINNALRLSPCLERSPSGSSTGIYNINTEATLHCTHVKCSMLSDTKQASLDEQTSVHQVNQNVDVVDNKGTSNTSNNSSNENQVKKICQ